LQLGASHGITAANTGVVTGVFQAEIRISTNRFFYSSVAAKTGRKSSNFKKKNKWLS
jgi:hypothetical protein